MVSDPAKNLSDRYSNAASYENYVERLETLASKGGELKPGIAYNRETPGEIEASFSPSSLETKKSETPYVYIPEDYLPGLRKMLAAQDKDSLVQLIDRGIEQVNKFKDYLLENPDERPDPPVKSFS